jgi:F0F1-type ATP synthase gamma subunit
MAEDKEIKDRISELDGLKTLIQTYEEIAAMRMRSTRSSVLLNRDFNEGLIFIFQRIKSSYKDQIALLVKTKKRKSAKESDKLSLLQRNGRTNLVLISANTKLYGDILQKTYNSFVDYIQKNQGAPIDITIIGRVGKALFEEDFPGKKYLYAEFPDNEVPTDNLTKLVKHLIEYEKIYFFFGKFQTVASQVSAVLDVYGQEMEGAKESHMKYLFEPSLEDILVLFESEIFASIIEQTLRESILAKFASRMVTLDSAAERIVEDLKKVEQERRIARHRAQNKKQFEGVRSMFLIK